VVAVGDTLARIARRYGVDQGALAAANGIANPNLIRLGAALVVPGGGGPAPAATSAPSAPDRLPARLRARPDRLALLPHFDAWAGAYGVPADLLKAMTWLESGWQHHVVSSAGAIGIGQLLPSTVTFVNGLLGTNLDPGLPVDNIRMSARFLRFLLDQTGGQVDQALAGYYQGLASVRARGLFPVTHGYVGAVLSLRSRF
jgi:soluble lytic murein transglycosylase-like protein